ncbi:hypothetical protein [Cytobacillus oceanisediminis]|uniref:hypothetical protein n=1 Tax=Cytobacillus oceanisediminis TaxID=665099 RepID=UPI001FB3ADBE|nr:hypothetical protein [Cytobacillus oceanisediminis]UOE58182.1 hypothetical protein IRB79_27135 [Cytobacillus oceanisediminis]
MKQFVFEGKATINRKFKIEITAENYEQAEEMALEILEEDPDDRSYYNIGDEEVEVEIDEVSEEPVSRRASYLNNFDTVA